MIETRCPTEDTLLPFATGETVAEDLRDHLAQCSECQRRVDRLRGELDDLRSVSPVPRRMDSPPRPSQIGKYLVVGELDSGGQSIVYRALHPTLDKELVIKLSREPLAGGSHDRDLLVREGKLLASLEHPNLARIYDLDFFGDKPFLVMEYVRGQTLSDYAKSIGVTPRQAAGLMAHVARALSAVHQRGIIHQDIKPRNIMIDEQNQPKLIDFGLARMRHAWENPDEPFGGTPAFTSPEQARGNAADVTVRSDIFCLGAVLYYLLTGKAPFDARTPTDALNQASRCDFDQSALDLVRPRKLAVICRRAMAADSNGRYARADSFASDLERVAAPLATRRALLIGAFGFATALFGLWLGPRLFDRHHFEPKLDVTVQRDNVRMMLHEAGELNPATDKLQFVAQVPENYTAAIYSYDVGSRVQQLNSVSTTSDGVQTLRFPGHGELIPLSGKGTTQVVIIAAAPDADTIERFLPHLADELEREFKDLVVPQHYSGRFDHRGVHTQRFGEPVPDPMTKTDDRLKHLSVRLQNFAPIILGVAFRY
jgi:eukaryotic-like serine/threonine-protein kinase